jgi:hypothetical protein
LNCNGTFITRITEIGSDIRRNGFLGVGEKNVAIEMLLLRKVRESNGSNDWFLVVNSSKEMLTNAPAYTTKPKS